MRGGGLASRGQTTHLSLQISALLSLPGHQLLTYYKVSCSCASFICQSQPAKTRAALTVSEKGFKRKRDEGTGHQGDRKRGWEDKVTI